MQIRPRRPRRMRLALYLIAGLGLINLARASAWQAQKAVLVTLDPRLSSNFASDVAISWAVFFAILAWLAWRNWSAIHLLLPGGLIAYGVYRLVVWQWWLTSLLTRRSDALLLVGYVISAGYLIWAFNSRRGRRYLMASHQSDYLMNQSTGVTCHSRTSG